MPQFLLTPFGFLKKILSNFFQWFRNTSRKKKILTVIAGVIVVLIIVGRVSSSMKPPEYTMAKAEKSNIREVVTESGNIVSTNSIQVYSPTNGIIEEVFVENGQIVERGDQLFSVVSSASEQERQSAYANYLAAKTALETAQATANTLRADMYSKWKQYTDLATNDRYESSDGVPNNQHREDAAFQIAQDSWKAAEASYKTQTTAIQQAQAALTSANQAYQATQNTTVTAPLRGTVVNVGYVSGSSVKANLPTAPSSAVLGIANLSSTEVRVLLNESDVIRVRPGQDVEVEVNAIDNKTFTGTVKRVDDVGTSEAGVIRYNAYIEILRPGNNLKSGMTSDVTITTKELRNVLAVPNSAVKPYQGGRAVRIVDPKTKQPKFIPVEIGIKGETKTQILKGLSEGDEVITSLGNEQLKRSSLF